MENLFMPSKYQ